MAQKEKSFPNANVIKGNYNYGILIVEGSYARIMANQLDGNIKANIALGGHNSGKTRIKYNYIMNSKQGEGIFVVEGEPDLLIEDNQIECNEDGIVLVNSQGKVKYNSIKTNSRSGILIAGRTQSLIYENNIEESNTGILVKDPAEPEFINNDIKKNNNQIEMEK